MLLSYTCPRDALGNALGNGYCKACVLSASCECLREEASGEPDCVLIGRYCLSSAPGRQGGSFKSRRRACGTSLSLQKTGLALENRSRVERTTLSLSVCQERWSRMERIVNFSIFILFCSKLGAGFVLSGFHCVEKWFHLYPL